jgi:hypothetical protein
MEREAHDMLERKAHDMLERAEREVLKELEARGQSTPIVTQETVERGGQSLVQIRLSDSTLARHQVPGLDRPVFIPYTPDALGDGDHDVASARKIVQTIGGLMQRGEIAVKPVVVYLALRAGRRLRTWVEGLDGALEPTEQALLTRRTSEITPGDADSLFVMAIVFPRPGQRVNAFDLPVPREWRAAMLRANRSLTVPGLMQIVWPEAAAPAMADRSSGPR